MRQIILVVTFMTISFSGLAQYGRLHYSFSVGPAFPLGKLRNVKTSGYDLTTTSGSSFNLGVDYDLSEHFGGSFNIAAEILGTIDRTKSFGLNDEAWVSRWGMIGAYYHHSWNKRFRVQTSIQLGLVNVESPFSNLVAKPQKPYQSSERNFGLGVQAKGMYYPSKLIGVFINTQLMHSSPEFSYGKQSFGVFRMELGLEVRFFK